MNSFVPFSQGVVELRNSYTMVCPLVCGDKLRASASGISRVHVNKHGITSLYHLVHRCRPFTLPEVS